MVGSMSPVMISQHERGFTLMEVLVSSLIVAAIAGGSMMAFVTAARIIRAVNGPTFAEGNQLASETLERMRNRIA